MIIRVFGFDRGDQIVDMIRLVRSVGSMGLHRTKIEVEKLLAKEIDSFVFECKEPNAEEVVREIESLGFLARVEEET